MKTLLNTVTCIAVGVTSLDSQAGEPASDQQLAERRAEYLAWIVENFGKLDMDPRDGRRWALNHARLALNHDVDEANEFFASFAPPGKDNDIYLIRFLRTLLDFRDSPQFSDAAEKHIIGFIETWPTRRHHLATRAHWPPGFTENHDLMYLTLALFGEQYRGGDGSVQVREIKRFIAHRMERGFVEWNSQCYQYHFSNPLIILADHAPDAGVRDAARMLLNVLLAERAVLGVQGYLGGPSLRCRTADVDHSLTARKVAYLSDGRYDGFLPTVWLAFGLGEPRFDFSTARDPELEPATIHIASGNEPRLKQDEGMFFACSRFLPHPVVQALAEEARTRKALVYQGRRFLGWPGDELWKTQKWLPGAITYYNAPHISMGSVHSDGWNHQSRYNSVLFGGDPSQALRVEMIVPGVKPHKRRHEARGRVVQHENWLLAQGTLFEDGGATAERVGSWNVYQVGKGLCAHIALGDDYHVLQVSDLDTFTSREEFVAALSLPERSGDRVEAVTMGGARLTVDLTNMGIAINGTPRPHPPKMLHDCELMTSVYGSGRITIRTTAGTVTFDGTPLRPEPTALPKLPDGHFRWGNPDSYGDTTKLDHVRAMGGVSPERDVFLKSVSILIPHNDDASARLAVYAGGTLARGPHVGAPARLLLDLGQTPVGQTGWVTMEHPTGVLIPSSTPIWLAWKASGGAASVTYTEAPHGQTNFQKEHGRWESKAIPKDPASPWPATWPSDDAGGFDAFWYSCFLTLEAPDD